VGFIKSPEEIRKIQSVYARCQFLNTRNLTVTFETTPDAVRRILPPPLEPTPEPVGTAWVGDVGTSNAVGPFTSLALFIKARYGEIVGNFCVASAMSTPEAMMFTRDLWGEPAKLAKLMFESQDEFIWGSAERYEVRYASLRGRLTGSANTGRRDSNIFHFKFSPRADGMGFDFPPQLVLLTVDTTIDVARRGRGELVFRDSPHDPVSEIPVKQVVEAVYTQGHTYVSARTLCEVDSEAFMPYAFNKTDAFDVVAEGNLLHAQAARKTRAGRGQYRNGA
jgi:acetoacetate decarboxylase